MNLELLSECRRCSLGGKCGEPVYPSTTPMPRIMVVASSPSEEVALLREPFCRSDREGALLHKFVAAAGIPTWRLHLTYAVKCAGKHSKTELQTCKSWLWEELKLNQPKVVVTLGMESTALLCQMKQPYLPMEELAGTFYSVEYMESLVAPWYSLSWLLNRGKAWEAKTITFLKTVLQRSESH